MATEKGVKYMWEHGIEHAHVKDGRAVLWASMPCTGGSPWQFVNQYLGHGLENYKQHWKLFHKLWNNFVPAAKRLIEDGNAVVIEWPKACAYWREKKVKKFIKEMGLTRVEWHGCAYRLRPSAPGVVGRGEYLKKPWILATNCPHIAAAFNRTCPGTSDKHKHIKCAGKNTKPTENYNTEIANTCLLYTSPSPRDS